MTQSDCWNYQLKSYKSVVKTIKHDTMRVMRLVTNLSSNDSVSPVEVFTVHMHRASFSLCNTSSSACRFYNENMLVLES